MAAPPPTLSLLETRVLGTLLEKQHTVPDAYPLTLNALVAGCNQKSSRLPVMEAAPAEVQGALDSLRSANLVIETSGGRVARYSHNFERVLQVPSQAAALLAVLMLRATAPVRGHFRGGGIPRGARRPAGGSARPAAAARQDGRPGGQGRPARGRARGLEGAAAR